MNNLDLRHGIIWKGASTLSNLILYFSTPDDATISQNLMLVPLARTSNTTNQREEVETNGRTGLPFNSEEERAGKE